MLRMHKASRFLRGFYIFFYSAGPNTYTENETIAKYEIMDGAPVRGKSYNFKLFYCTSGGVK